MLAKTTGLLAAALLMASTAHAGLPAQAKPHVAQAIQQGGKVVVIFQARKDAAAAAGALAAAMQVKGQPDDAQGGAPGRWVSDISYQVHDSKSGCGLIIGTWWTEPAGKGAGAWERLVHERIKSSVRMVSYQYARNGDLQVLSQTVGSKEDALIDQCFVE